MTATTAPEAVLRRHPIRGFLWGLVAGLGLSLLLIGLGVIALGTLAPLVTMFVVALLGVVWGLVGPAKTHGDAPQVPPAVTPPPMPAATDASAPDAPPPAPGATGAADPGAGGATDGA